MTKNDLIKVRVSLLEYARHTGFEATESLRIIDEELAAEPQHDGKRAESQNHHKIISGFFGFISGLFGEFRTRQPHR